MVAVIVQLLVGMAALLLGRQIFWVFVGAVGFFVGLFVAPIWFSQLPEWATLLASLAVGVVLAMLAILIQKPMASIAGFFAMGSFVLGIVTLITGRPAFGAQADWLIWVVFIVGGLIGAIIVFVAFDWALIMFSSLVGANIIIDALREASALPAMIATLFFIIMVAVGIWAQSRMLPRTRPAASRAMRA